MRTLFLAGAVWAISLAANVLAGEWTFDDIEVGKLPTGWTAAKTGTGPGSVWQVIEDKTAPSGAKVLAQVSSEGPKRLFNLCVAGAAEPADLDLSVMMKPVRGKIDQGGGPVWRYQDHDNYYICRFNPLEFNFRLYKVIGGKRTQLATAAVELPDDAKTDAFVGKWHAIRVIHQGTKIQCSLNGKIVLKAEDTAIANPGKVGLWTKADAVSSFDNLKVTTPPNTPR